MLPSPAETAGFLALAGESDLVAGVVGWADLTSTAIPETLAVLRSGPGGARLVGIRHLVQGEPDPRWLARPDVRRGLRAVAEAGLVYDPLTLPHQLPAAVDTVRALPGLTFVLDHLSKPPSDFLFSNDPAHSRPWNPDWVTHRVCDLAKAAGVDLWASRESGTTPPASSLPRASTSAEVDRRAAAYFAQLTTRSAAQSG